MSEASLAGIPLELLPTHVQEGLGRPQPLELAISADAIATMLGTNAELAMSKVKVCSAILLTEKPHQSSQHHLISNVCSFSRRLRLAFYHLGSGPKTRILSLVEFPLLVPHRSFSRRTA